MVVNTGPNSIQNSVMFSALTSPWDFSRAAAQSALESAGASNSALGGNTNLQQALDASRKSQNPSSNDKERQQVVME